jgi:hypothetical protein
LLREESVKHLYKNTINKQTVELNLNNNISQVWEKIKYVVHKTAKETLGKRKKS